MCVCLSAHVCACVGVYAHERRIQQRPEEGIRSPGASVTDCPVWVLGTELRSSGRAASALNHWAILGPQQDFKRDTTYA